MYHSTNLALLEPETKPCPARTPLILSELKQLHVFLAEDVTSDVRLTKAIMDATGISYALTHISRGDEVLPKLHTYRNEPMPDLLLLDLGLPSIDGFEILAELAEMPAAQRSVSIGILTAHQHFEYLEHSYPNLHIIGYIQKPCPVEYMRSIMLHACKKESSGSLPH